MNDKNTPAAFIARWLGITGSERANYQLFIGELCRLLDVPAPQPAHDDTRDNAYVFERRISFAHGDGSSSAGFIDCYKRGAFVLEAKRVKAGKHTQGFDDALLRARAQAEGYARALPAAEGRPPFVLVVDVGHVIELYAEFTRSGATYTPFPDSRSHRIRLDDLNDEAVRQRLRTLWLDPMALDPARASAKVTRQVAVQLAALARSLESDGHSAEHTAAFLTRCLFSMFAEDVGLLPRMGGDENSEGAFVGLLKRHRDDAPTLQKMLAVLWADMDRGGFSAALAKDVLRFNGKLFKGWQSAGPADYVLPLKRGQIDGLLAAAQANWREVEPAIFGTLLEWALDADERHALGAHYTPRAYVERLVLPTVVEPLRADWANAQAAALLLANEANALDGKKRDDKLAEARAEIRRFHRQLCTLRVLDPACGSGNFLYVTLEHLKRLEGEVLDQLDALGDTQGRLGLAGETVTLQQLRGIEINERAPLPLPLQRHRPDPRPRRAHPPARRTTRRPPQVAPGGTRRRHADRPVQRTRQAAQRRAAVRQGQAAARTRPGVGAALAARRAGLSHAASLRLGRPAKRTGRPRAGRCRGARRSRRCAARTPGGAERQACGRRSRRHGALAAARLPAARRGRRAGDDEREP